MEGGAAITGAATAVAAVAFAWAAWITYVRADEPMSRSHAIPTFFGIVALFLSIAALRQFVALQPGWVAWDRRLFMLSVVPAAYSIVPLVHLGCRCLDWHWRRRRKVVWTIAAGATVGVAFVFIGGVAGPQVSAWGSEWRILSPITQLLVLLVVTLPGLTCSLLLMSSAARLRGADRRRINLVGTACLVYWVAFTFDAFAAPGPALVVERLLTAWAAVTTLHAYRHVHPVRLAAIERAEARRIGELV